MQEAAQVRDLMNEWLSYAGQALKPNVQGFSVWLNDKYHAPKPGLNACADMVPPEAEGYPMEYAMGFLWGKLMRYTHIWIKVAFQDMPLKGFEDFGILKNIAFLQNPTKKEVAHHALMEQSTAFEVLKRMQKLGFVIEAPDANDKRIKRVMLTPDGEKVLKQAEEKAIRTCGLLMGELGHQNKKHLYTTLHTLTQFHDRLYEEGPEVIHRRFLDETIKPNEVDQC